MNPRRFTTVAPAFCGSLVLAGVIVGWLAGFGSAGTENTGAVPIENGAASLAANARLVDEPQAIAMANAVVANAAVANAEVATAAQPAAGTATDTTAASDKPESIVVAALPDPSQTLSADLPPVQESVDLGHHDVAQPVPTTRNASNPAPVTQDFRYLIYYVWSELPPAEKPADIVLRSLKDTPVGTPVEEIKRASDAFGLDSNFMTAVAKIEFRFRPQATHRVVYRPVPTEQIRVQQIRLRADFRFSRQCHCGGLQGHYRRHSVRVGDAEEADLE